MSQGYEKPKAPDFDRGFDQFGLPAQETKEGHGCFYYGCITAIVLLVLMIVASFLIYQKISKTLRQYVATYTDDSPVKLPVVEMPDEERQATIKRAEDFQKALTTPPPDGAGPAPDDDRTLVLNVDELNALLEQSPEVRGKFYVSIVNDELKARVSLPLEDLPGLKGRFLNAEANVDVSIDNGTPVLRLKDVQVKGRPIPEGLRPMFEQTNWLENARTKDGRLIGPLLAEKIEKIEVKDGKVTVVVRKPSAPGPGGKSSSGPILEWKAADGGNGHFYELVRTARSWTDADHEAGSREHKGMKGHLATAAGAEENAFLRDRVAVDSLAWIGLTDDRAHAHGGGEAPGGDDPRHEHAGWVWVTGEPVAFVAWADGEPTPRGDKAGGRFGEFNGRLGAKRGLWNARPDDVEGGRFAIVEYEPAADAGPRGPAK